MAHVGIFITEGCRDDELDFLRKRLEAADHHVTIMGVEAAFDRLDPEELCGAVLPDGRWPADASLDEHTKRFLRVLHMAGRPIAAFSGGVRMLAAAGIGRGCTLTSPPSDRDMLERAGAKWVDTPVATHGHLLSAQGAESMEELMELFLPAIEAFQQLTPTEYLLETRPPS